MAEKQIPPAYGLATSPEGHSLRERASFESSQSLADPVDGELPAASHPTVALIIPFPALLCAPVKKDVKIPPFVMYAPLAAPLKPPAEGEKESKINKAIRKWQKEEKQAREKGTGFKAKAVGLISKGMSATKNSRIEFLVRTPNKKKLKELRFVYPSSWAATDVQKQFTDLVKSAKKGAIMNGVISTCLAPVALAFDTLTFIPGPFEITAVWSASSWKGAARATGIANRITSDQLPISFSPNNSLEALKFRLHELCWRKVKAGTVASPAWPGGALGNVKRGPELASIVLAVLREYGEDMDDVETDLRTISEDLERCLKKAVKEWAKAVNKAMDS
ncbi:uncharacterized protein LAESUDRAFT_728775 [Laetiporus sulphureus 93-53]|uniref:Uncharacterized protein n=1 Tax=Laetiporus sulphureus 93-53 TaxID=1314785 RepID=A0A165CYI1_9APHY|nr:uncharacterized protein LAESUDRAFT_728775 [Laetiporus sulphureus 93-53]KZT03752.1 hypothetical protein LAESUDRAFT_728775 [Laetiporus sulphureus 93-53]